MADDLLKSSLGVDWVHPHQNDGRVLSMGWIRRPREGGNLWVAFHVAEREAARADVFYQGRKVV